MRIEQVHLENYRVFRDTTLAGGEGGALPTMAVVVGANGSGKSTLFDVFGFLRDALAGTVDSALAKRGGFGEVRTRDADGPIVIEIKFRDDGPRITYRLEIVEEDGRPIIDREVLRYRRGPTGRPWHFLDFSRGSGRAVTNEMEEVEDESQLEREESTLDQPDILAIKGLGQFKRFPAILSFRRLIEHWHVSDFHIDEARPSHEAGHAEHLSSSGDNLALFAKFLYERHPDRFGDVLEKMRRRVPGVEAVQADLTVDGRLVLRFQDGSFKDPFVARYVSDGTIKMFAYLLLLHDPSPHPLLCVEEPENQIYHSLLGDLAEEFQSYADAGGQVLISTHSPEFLDAVELEQIYYLVKVEGCTEIRRAAEDENLRSLVAAGEPPGMLWMQRLFPGADPA